MIIRQLGLAFSFAAVLLDLTGAPRNAVTGVNLTQPVIIYSELKRIASLP
jgi:hypothetical protein